MYKNKITLLAFFILAVLFVGLTFWQNSKNSAVDWNSLREVEIRKGMSFGDVSRELISKGLISSETIFKIYGALSGSFDEIKPGRYFLPENIEISKLIGMLVRGPEQISVTIVPGMTIAEIDDELSAAKIIKPGELVSFNVENLKNQYSWLPDNAKGRIGGPLEGFLMPDTYDFFAGVGINLAVEVLLDNFQKKTAAAGGGLLFSEERGNILKIIILASILEKEVPDDSERRLVAGILNKRLSVRMPLQADAVLVYENCGGRFLNCPALSRSDYKIDSAYNVYMNQGFPPGPISNPSSEAINAALNPEKSSYWYYLSDPKTKQTIFSETLDEHNENRAKYLGM